MSRKKSRGAGAKRRGPTERRKSGGFSSDPLQRMMEAEPFAYCSEESVTDVSYFVREWLAAGASEDENFSVFMSEDPELSQSVILLYQVSDIMKFGLQKAIEDHPMYKKWGVWFESERMDR